MICRLIRQLRGKGQRAAQAEELFQRHHETSMKVIEYRAREVAAVEKLVQDFKKDATLWPLS